MRAWQMVAQAGWAVQLHLLTVVPAFAIGTWMIFVSRKGARPHRAWGTVYMSLMVATAIAAIFVRDIHPPHLSPIHLFVPLTLGSVAVALWAVRRGRISTHRNAMIALYVGGLLIAGTFTFTPGRLLHRMFIG